MIPEIIILAMIAAFLGMRLYSVLGRRAEHEEEMVANRFERPEDAAPPQAQAVPQAEAPRVENLTGGFAPAIERGLRDIAAADRTFQLLPFLEGARGAYRMVLEAFWRGDREELRQLCDDDVYASFDAAIAEREAAGHVLDNRLIRIEDSTIHSAMLDGRTARISVRFVSDIASLTRDKDGTMIAGSLDDAVESRDVWTFTRNVNATGPDWLLDETDVG
ncbi:Tim44 domain-containing protein [Aurantiacibacter xanthus]|uniref:Tim44 domain-containing protein n=1 Tax=Aurantiacibacter xanthus TaxID=1784712 RepID=A0A3A1P3S8_9SPHN|nr:Tim44/TimA family putative adaptor protein [Aurantiacibacter xanthus]RIV86135.1 Tim44 domain-containing protein [Aurantiacibacter xanthus]